MLKHFLLSVALSGAVCAFATEGVNEMATQLFGSEEAEKRVSDGVVFIDGCFLRGPYSVTREGNVILVNGQIASRFKVEAAAAKAAAERAASAGAADPGLGERGSEGRVSDEEGETIGSEPTPELDASGAASGGGTKPSAIEAKLAKQKGGGSIEERLAAKQRAKNLKAESSKGAFNQEATPADPMALFEEADYTYTPPSKPEPKAVPYVRPAAQKSMAERAAEAKQKDAAATQKAMTVQEGAEEEDGEEAEGEEIAIEEFDDLTEEEIEAYTKKFAARREQIEKALNADGMVLLSSATSGLKIVKRPTMWKFIPQFEALAKEKNASKLVGKWGKVVPPAYLQKMFDQRTESLKNMKTLLLRIKREQREAEKRKKSRL